MIELLPCPFCGSEEHITMFEEQYGAECKECGAWLMHEGMEYRAIKKWDTRSQVVPAKEPRSPGAPKTPPCRMSWFCSSKHFILFQKM